MIDLQLRVCRRWFAPKPFAVHLSETLLIRRTASASLGYALDWSQYSKGRYDTAQRDADHAGRGRDVGGELR
jgi:hypothetical protein